MRKRTPEKIDPLDVKIGGRVRQVRLLAGDGQAEVGRLLGFTHGSTLYRYELGHRPFTHAMLIIVSERYDVSIHWLVTGREFRSKAARRRASHVDPIVGAIEALRESARCGELSTMEIRRLREHLRADGSAELYDLEHLVKQWRHEASGSEEDMRALLEADERRAESLGVRKRKSAPPPPLAAATPRRRKHDRAN